MSTQIHIQSPLSDRLDSESLLPTVVSPSFTEPTTVDKRDKNTPDEWITRHPKMIRLTGAHPFNAEPKLDYLLDRGFWTPTSLFYVRNHGPVPMLDHDSHTISIEGLLKHPQTFTMADLRALPSVTIPVSLSCAGNRRKEQNVFKRSNGFSWGPAAVGCATWTGVPLCELLSRCGVNMENLGDQMHYVNFDGCDDLPKGYYGTSLKLPYAMNPVNDVLVAYDMNGKPLTPDHGAPVRIIIPGFIGGRMVKWLKKITVSTLESDSFYHFHDNRVLPPPVNSADQALAEKWWFDFRYIINERNINSAIALPAHDTPAPSSGPLKLSGYAYSGGGRQVTRVEVSLDDGVSWQLVRNVQYPVKPRHGHKYWCWFLWEHEVDASTVNGDVGIVVRAWDDGQNTQPKDITWNLLGMMNNPWYRVRVLDGVFRHPAPVAKTKHLGWMEQTGKNISDAAQLAVPRSQVKTKRVKGFTLDAVAKHNKNDDCWIVIDGSVYDVTGFLDAHPGGVKAIMLVAGTDASDAFNAIHSDKARKWLEKFKVGEVDRRSKL